MVISINSLLLLVGTKGLVPTHLFSILIVRTQKNFTEEEELTTDTQLMGPFWPSELCKSKEFPTLVVFY
jgi:hypothetical protein